MNADEKPAPRITRILVPLDTSRVAEGALPYGEALARVTGASLTLLTVAPSLPAESVLKQFKTVRSFQRGRERDCRAYLKRTAAALSERGVKTTSLVRHGNPAQTIRRIAERNSGTIVAMATHGEGGLVRWAVGSAADRVMRTCAVPVLLICPSDLSESPPQVMLRQLLVPLDGSPLAEHALPLAGEIAQAAGASVRLVRAEPHVAAGEWPLSVHPAKSELLDQMLGERARDYLLQARDGLPAGVKADTAVLRNAANVLPEYAAFEQADLVVMASHGRGGLHRATLGSVADRMVRQGMPTLIVRVQDEQPEREAGPPALVAVV